MAKKKTRDIPSLEGIVEVLKALANPTRLRIVTVLLHSECSVSAIAEKLDLRPCIVSQQLAILRMSGIVRGESAGGHAFYSLVDPLTARIIECIYG